MRLFQTHIIGALMPATCTFLNDLKKGIVSLKN